MSGETARLKLAELPEGQAMNAAEINTVLGQLDALVDCCLKGVFVDAAPAGAADGDIYLVGASPSGDWGAEYTYKLAYRRDGAWEPPVIPFEGMRAFVPATNAFLVYCNGVWTDWNSLISAAETSIASAATCDIGAAGSLFLAVTGSAAIASFGTAANTLRFLRFAGALTLAHDATALILPGAADIVTAAGDTACFTSDAGGNWRCRFYARADGRMVDMDSPAFTGTVSGPDGGTWSSSGLRGVSALYVGTDASGGWQGSFGAEFRAGTGNAVLSSYSTSSSTDSFVSRVDATPSGLFVGYHNTTLVALLNVDASENITWRAYNGAFNVVAGTGSAGVRLTIGATSWASSSTQDAKTDLETITGAVDIVCAHTPRLGRYKTDDPSRPLRPFLMYEDAVAHWPYAAQTEGDFKGVAKEDYIPLLMAAVRELAAEISVLKGEA